MLAGKSWTSSWKPLTASFPAIKASWAWRLPGLKQCSSHCLKNNNLPGIAKPRAASTTSFTPGLLRAVFPCRELQSSAPGRWGLFIYHKLISWCQAPGHPPHQFYPRIAPGCVSLSGTMISWCQAPGHPLRHPGILRHRVRHPGILHQAPGHPHPVIPCRELQSVVHLVTGVVYPAGSQHQRNTTPLRQT